MYPYTKKETRMKVTLLLSNSEPLRQVVVRST